MSIYRALAHICMTGYKKRSKLKVVFLTTMLFVLAHNSSFASVYSESVIEFSEIREGVGLDENIFLYKDASRKLGIGEIIGKEFKLNEKTYLNFGYNNDADWLKFTLCNTGYTENTYLKIDKLLLDTVSLFSYNKQQNVWDTLTLGLEILQSEKTNLTSSIYFPIDIPQNDTLTFYVRCVSIYGKTFSASIVNNRLIHRGDTRFSIYMGLYAGILLSIILYNLFLGFSVKDNLYFHYVLAHIFTLLAGIALKGFTIYLIPDSFAHLTSYITTSFIGLYMPFCSNFNIRILDLKNTSRFAYYLMIGVAGITVIGVIIIHFLRYYGIQTNYAFVGVSGMVFTITAFVSGIIAYRKGHKYARYYLIGWAAVLIGLFMFTSTLLGYLPKNVVTYNFYNIGMALEVILLSFALADRYNIIQKEKNKLELELQYKTKDLTKVVTDNKLRHEFKNNLLNQLKTIYNKKNETVKQELGSFISNLNIQLGDDERRIQLQGKIDKVNAEFETKLKERFPNLTKNEIEILSYLKLNLSIKEIAGLRNTSVKTISMAKYRLNKKMQEAGSSIDEILNEI